MKFLKLLIGILLVPFAVGLTRAFFVVGSIAVAADQVLVMLLAGCGCWLAILTLLPKPMWVYVVGHELTHAVWTWFFGGRVKAFKATANGGHVIITKNNFLITLAPYFFPFYSVVVVLLFVLGNTIWNWSSFRPIFHLLLGATYCFHVTLTLSVLKTQQTDITSQGYWFSFMVIWIGNMIVLIAGLAVLTGRVSFGELLQIVWRETWYVTAKGIALFNGR